MKMSVKHIFLVDSELFLISFRKLYMARIQVSHRKKPKIRSRKRLIIGGI